MFTGFWAKSGGPIWARVTLCRRQPGLHAAQPRGLFTSLRISCPSLSTCGISPCCQCLDEKPNKNTGKPKVIVSRVPFVERGPSIYVYIQHRAFYAVAEQGTWALGPDSRGWWSVGAGSEKPCSLRQPVAYALPSSGPLSGERGWDPQHRPSRGSGGFQGGA